MTDEILCRCGHNESSHRKPPSPCCMAPTGYAFGAFSYGCPCKKFEVDGEETVTFTTKRCFRCGNTTDVEVVASGLDRWQAGELIQDAFPDIPIDIREMMVSGMHPECWETMFGERDE